MTLSFNIGLATILTLMGLAYIQNISFSLVSRARNRDHVGYHIVASILSNGIWFLTFHILVVEDMNFVLFLPYCVGTVAGSVTGAQISQRIERWLGAKT